MTDGLPERPKDDLMDRLARSAVTEGRSAAALPSAAAIRTASRRVRATRLSVGVVSLAAASTIGWLVLPVDGGADRVVGDTPITSTTRPAGELDDLFVPADRLDLLTADGAVPVPDPEPEVVCDPVGTTPEVSELRALTVMDEDGGLDLRAGIEQWLDEPAAAARFYELELSFAACGEGVDGSSLDGTWRVLARADNAAVVVWDSTSPGGPPVRALVVQDDDVVSWLTVSGRSAWLASGGLDVLVGLVGSMTDRLCPNFICGDGPVIVESTLPGSPDAVRGAPNPTDLDELLGGRWETLTTRVDPASPRSSLCSAESFLEAGGADLRAVLQTDVTAQPDPDDGLTYGSVATTRAVFESSGMAAAFVERTAAAVFDECPAAAPRRLPGVVPAWAGLGTGPDEGYVALVREGPYVAVVEWQTGGPDDDAFAALVARSWERLSELG